MNETEQGAGRTSSHAVIHEMLEASARLGSYPPARRPARVPRFGHQLQYDESGFPIPEDRAGFTERVRQLLRG
jgi:hypothetical protein